MIAVVAALAFAAFALAVFALSEMHGLYERIDGLEGQHAMSAAAERQARTSAARPRVEHHVDLG